MIFVTGIFHFMVLNIHFIKFWDSFAEANWKANKIEKTIEYYNKAIELDPKGVTGDNSRRMLDEIKKAKPF